VILRDVHNAQCSDVLNLLSVVPFIGHPSESWSAILRYSPDWIPSRKFRRQRGLDVIEGSVRRQSDLHRWSIEYGRTRQRGHLERHPPQDESDWTVSRIVYSINRLRWWTVIRIVYSLLLENCDFFCSLNSCWNLYEAHEQESANENQVLMSMHVSHSSTRLCCCIEHVQCRLHTFQFRCCLWPWRSTFRLIKIVHACCMILFIEGTYRS